jgi:hypothetical protein
MYLVGYTKGKATGSDTRNVVIESMARALPDHPESMVRTYYTAGDPWYEAYADGVKLTLAGLVELMAYMRAITRYAGTIRYVYEHGRATDAGWVGEWLKNYRETGVMPATMPAFYERCVTSMSKPEVQRALMTGTTMFYVIYPMWLGAVDRRLDSESPRAQHIRRTLQTHMYHKWDMLYDHVHDTTLSDARRQEIQHIVARAVWHTGYLPAHLCREMGLPIESPEDVRHPTIAR